MAVIEKHQIQIHTCPTLSRPFRDHIPPYSRHRWYPADSEAIRYNCIYHDKIHKQTIDTFLVVMYSSFLTD